MFCSGLIAGEGIIGIVLAILAFGIVYAEKAAKKQNKSLFVVFYPEIRYTE